MSTTLRLRLTQADAPNRALNAGALVTNAPAQEQQPHGLGYAQRSSERDAPFSPSHCCKEAVSSSPSTHEVSTATTRRERVESYMDNRHKRSYQLLSSEQSSPKDIYSPPTERTLSYIPRDPPYTAGDPWYALSNPPYSLIDHNSEDPVDPFNHSISYDTTLDNYLVNDMDNSYKASGSQLTFEPDTESKYLPATLRQPEEWHIKPKTQRGQATVSSQRSPDQAISYNRHNKSVTESPDLSKYSPTIAVQLDEWLAQPRTWQHEEATSSRHSPEQATSHNSRSSSATSSPELRKYLPYLPDTPAYAITDKEIADYSFQPVSAGLISETRLDPEISRARRTLWRLARNLYNLPMPTQQDSYTPNQSCETWATHLFELLDIVTTFRPTCLITNKLIPAQDMQDWPEYGELHIAYNSLVAKTIRQSNEFDLLLPTPEWPASECLFDACAFEVAAVSFRDQMERSIQRLHDILTKSITVQDLPHKSSTNHLPATNHPQGDPPVHPLDLEVVSVLTPTFTLECDNSPALPVWKSVDKLIPIVDEIPVEAVKGIASNEQLSNLWVNKIAQPLVTIKKRNGITSRKESLAKPVKQPDNESIRMMRDQFRSTTPLPDEALCDPVHINSHHSFGNLSHLHVLVTTSSANGIIKHTGTPSNLTSHGPTSIDTHISNTHAKRTISNDLTYKEAAPRTISGLSISQASHSPDEFHNATDPFSSMITKQAIDASHNNVVHTSSSIRQTKEQDLSSCVPRQSQSKPCLNQDLLTNAPNKPLSQQEHGETLTGVCSKTLGNFPDFQPLEVNLSLDMKDWLVETIREIQQIMDIYAEPTVLHTSTADSAVIEIERHSALDSTRPPGPEHPISTILPDKSSKSAQQMTKLSASMKSSESLSLCNNSHTTRLVNDLLLPAQSSVRIFESEASKQSLLVDKIDMGKNVTIQSALQATLSRDPYSALSETICSSESTEISAADYATTSLSTVKDVSINSVEGSVTISSIDSSASSVSTINIEPSTQVSNKPPESLHDRMNHKTPTPSFDTGCISSELRNEHIGLHSEQLRNLISEQTLVHINEEPNSAHTSLPIILANTEGPNSFHEYDSSGTPVILVPSISVAANTAFESLAPSEIRNLSPDYQPMALCISAESSAESSAVDTELRIVLPEKSANDEPVISQAELVSDLGINCLVPEEPTTPGRDDDINQISNYSSISTDKQLPPLVITTKGLSNSSASDVRIETAISQEFELPLTLISGILSLTMHSFTKRTNPECSLPPDKLTPYESVASKVLKLGNRNDDTLAATPISEHLCQYKPLDGQLDMSTTLLYEYNQETERKHSTYKPEAIKPDELDTDLCISSLGTQASGTAEEQALQHITGPSYQDNFTFTVRSAAARTSRLHKCDRGDSPCAHESNQSSDEDQHPQQRTRNNPLDPPDESGDEYSDVPIRNPIRAQSFRPKPVHFDPKLEPDNIPEWNGDTSELPRWIISINNLAEYGIYARIQLGRQVPLRLTGRALRCLRRAITIHFMNRSLIDRNKAKALQAGFRDRDNLYETPVDYIVRKAKTLTLFSNWTESELITEIMNSAPEHWSLYIDTSVGTTWDNFLDKVAWHEDRLLRHDNNISQDIQKQLDEMKEILKNIEIQPDSNVKTNRSSQGDYKELSNNENTSDNESEINEKASTQDSYQTL
ncbi:hypothetical protein RHS01_11233 [Rhizoctonia solani]|uniref:Uncharacterized protein n=1 Tax=Rhizoctonia solani TaxID=456999 RepID=A0A8H7I093_9AGAM|nr:hypothetical protein RHS01_11233 [Rhizoctonia solani]